MYNQIRKNLKRIFSDYCSKRKDFYGNVNIPMGCDNVPWKAFVQNQDEYFLQIAKEILDEQFFFQPLLVNYRKSKPNKTFYVSCIQDYLVEKMLFEFFEERFERRFEHLEDILYSYSFGNTQGKLVTRMQKDLYDSKSVLRIDMKKCMPSINLDILKKVLDANFFNENEVFYNLLILSLHRKDANGNEIKGIPPGTPLSNFFMNIFLTQVDEFVLSGIVNDYSLKYYRYGDDLFFVHKDSLKFKEVVIPKVKEFCKTIDLMVHDLDDLGHTIIYEYKKNVCYVRFNNYTFNENVISLKHVVYLDICNEIKEVIENIYRMTKGDLVSFTIRMNEYIMGDEKNNRYSLLSRLIYVTNMDQILCIDKYIKRNIRKKFNIEGKIERSFVSILGICKKRRYE